MMILSIQFIFAIYNKWHGTHENGRVLLHNCNKPIKFFKAIDYGSSKVGRLLEFSENIFIDKNYCLKSIYHVLCGLILNLLINLGDETDKNESLKLKFGNIILWQSSTFESSYNKSNEQSKQLSKTIKQRHRTRTRPIKDIGRVERCDSYDRI